MAFPQRDAVMVWTGLTHTQGCSDGVSRYDSHTGGTVIMWRGVTHMGIQRWCEQVWLTPIRVWQWCEQVRPHTHWNAAMVWLTGSLCRRECVHTQIHTQTWAETAARWPQCMKTKMWISHLNAKTLGSPLTKPTLCVHTTPWGGVGPDPHLDSVLASLTTKTKLQPACKQQLWGRKN